MVHLGELEGETRIFPSLQVVFHLSQTFPIRLKGVRKTWGFSYFPLPLHWVIFHLGFAVYYTMLCDSGMVHMGIGFCFLTLSLLFIQQLSLIFSLWTNIFHTLHLTLHRGSLCQTNYVVSHLIYSDTKSSLYFSTWLPSVLIPPPSQAPAHGQRHPTPLKLPVHPFTMGLNAPPPNFITRDTLYISLCR